MKLILILMILGCFVFLGLGLSRYYIDRKRFFSELELFVSNLSSNINFGREKIVDIIQKYENNRSVYLKKLCENYEKTLKDKSGVNENIFDGITILKNEERQLLVKFFSTLGKFDIYSQTKEIASYSARINELYSEASLDCKKYASLIIKLSLIVGLLVCLLII